jgi:hypothetical protein
MLNAGGVGRTEARRPVGLLPEGLVRLDLTLPSISSERRRSGGIIEWERHIESSHRGRLVIRASCFVRSG